MTEQSSARQNYEYRDDDWTYRKLGAVYGLRDLKEIDGLPLTDPAKNELFQAVRVMRQEAEEVLRTVERGGEK